MEQTTANMQEEDYKVLRNEARANPDTYDEWDPQHQLRRKYAEAHHDELSTEERIRLETSGGQHQGRHGEGRTMSEASIAQEAVATPLDTRDDREEEEAAHLSRHTSTSTATSASTSSTHSARLEEIRTARSTPTTARGRSATMTLQASTGNFLHLHPTERHPEALRRIETHRSQHAGTVGASGVESRLTRTLTRRRTERPLPSLGAGKPFPPPLPEREEYVVEFDGVDDPLHAQNWPMKKKLYIGAILAFDALAATMGSSIFSAATKVVGTQFGVAPVVGTLGTSLYVFGYAFGPLVRNLIPLLL